MRAYDIIEKKRNGDELSFEEINYLINGYVQGEIPDYQMSAFLMAVYFKGMTDTESEALTKCMLNSGETADLSGIFGMKVDKHSTGGVGDKTTLIIAPIVAACGAKVAKMSGRGLGHTGGTIDKLESIKGFKTALDREKFFEIVNKVGCSVISQTGNLVPADKKIYALRDVTATVESIPLIASSIMSKKLASGADCILLDVKVGDGAFMKNTENAVKLSKLMVSIGAKFGKKIAAVVTSMHEPLGNAIGNHVEVWEACEILSGRGPEDLKELSVYLSAQMLNLCGVGSFEECKKMAEKSIENGTALEKFREMVKAQGATEDLPVSEVYPSKSKVVYECKAEKDGFVTEIKASNLGKAAMILGAGRETKEASIDYFAGMILNKKVGSKVKKGEVLATFYSSSEEKCKQAEKIALDAIKISKEKGHKMPLIQAEITAEDVIHN